MTDKEKEIENFRKNILPEYIDFVKVVVPSKNPKVIELLYEINRLRSALLTMNASRNKVIKQLRAYKQELQAVVTKDRNRKECK